jgi:hypothetical protein
VELYEIEHGVKVEKFAVADRNVATWPSLEGKTVLFIGVTMEDTQGATKDATMVYFINAQDSFLPGLHTQSEVCLSVQLWEYYHKETAPEFLQVIDRFSRWASPSVEDRYVREYLTSICHVSHKSTKGPKGHYERALAATDKFVMAMMDETEEKMAMLEKGKQMLEAKQRYLERVLSGGKVYHIHYGYLMDWKLPEKWLGARVYVVNNTVAIDSTEAAHMVLSNKATNVDVFVNFRVMNGQFIFSARSKKLSLTEVFKGHDLAAGGAFGFNEGPIPFVEIPPHLRAIMPTPTSPRSSMYRAKLSYPARQSFAYVPKMEDFPPLSL